ncbi:MAG: hypothetical protein LQ340_002557 [Diploschistes diacapsis]|nr:MAG: hypothetical protein LQ340_002557 [Diploschistes diacapsis]
MWTTIHYHPTKTLDPGPQGDPFVSLTPSKACSYLGVLDDQHIKPITIGAMWYPRLYSPVNDSGKKVFLYFHGGAYVLGGCRPSRGGYAPELLAKVSGGTTLAPQYRLAWQHGGCFPAPIQDAITAYAHLLSLGIKAEDIIFSGESAGGNLALVTLRYLINHGASAGLPRPGGVCVFSPWVDMTMTADEILKSPQFRTDWLPTELPDYATDLYVPLHKRANDEYMSILGNEFATDVPIFVQTGDAEILYDSNVAVVEGMRKKGARVACHVIKNAGDDAFGTAPVLGLTREAENIAAAAIKFIEG